MAYFDLPDDRVVNSTSLVVSPVLVADIDVAVARVGGRHEDEAASK
jgi:hypothetical protein